MKRIRQPIVTVAGHVDHGKTSILDFFRGTSVQEREGGGITQKISYTKFPLKHIKNACHLIDEQGIKIDIPGFLFIDTPGHAAFTSLRKRGGSLSDLVILVVSIKEGIKPQTMEVLQILKKYKIPFLIALNKIDTIFGKRQDFKSLRETIENSSIHVYQEFKEALLTFQCSLAEHGFDSDLFYDINDFGKKIAIVPCSAKTGEGISELLFVLTGLCQKFLLDKLELSEEVRGVVLEVKKDKGMDYIEVILSDGCLEIGDEIAIAGFNGIITSKIRALEEIEPLCFDYCNVKKISASSGARIHFTNKERILPGMPFRRIDGNLDKLKNEFKEDLSSVVNLDKEGIIVKADSLGSLGALLFLLKNEGIKVVKAGIGHIKKGDIVSAKANLEINPLNSVILGFNVCMEEDFSLNGIKVLLSDIVYKLIEDLEKWRKNKQSEIEREKIMGLSMICKIEVLHKYVFRNSNPAIFGVRVLGGKLKKGIMLIDNFGEQVSRVKSLQKDRESVYEVLEGEEVAVSLPGINFDRRIKDIKYLYSNLIEKNFRDLKKNKYLLSSEEMRIIQEIVNLKRKYKEDWGV